MKADLGQYDPQQGLAMVVSALRLTAPEAFSAARTYLNR